MKDIELVIKLSEKEYELCKKYKGHLGDHRIISDAIANGIPLPKGHGRISDMDAAIKCIEDVEGEDAIWAISLIEWACSKRTIIEADKTESENP